MKLESRSVSALLWGRCSDLYNSNLTRSLGLDLNLIYSMTALADRTITKMPAKSANKHVPNLIGRQKRYMTLSLKADFKARTISARFHSIVNARNRNSNRCTCSEDERYHVAPARILSTDVQRLRFILEKDSHIRKAQSAIQKAQKEVLAAETEIDFINLIDDLSNLLARWCTGRTTQNSRWDAGNTEMRPFRSPALAPSAHRDHVVHKVREHLTENEIRDNGLGYIYILRSHNPTTQAELMIGFSRFHPQHRSQELARCLIRPEVVAHTQLLPFAKRVEAFIHAELDSFRKIQWCSWCHRNHQEWFTIAIDRARRTVARWSKFILSRPYIAGKIRDDVSNHFEYSEATSRSSEVLDPDSFWDKVVNSLPVDESRYSRVQQIGTYLNAIWMYRNIQDWTNSAPDWKLVPRPQSFDIFYDSYFCSDEVNEVRKAMSNLDFETLRSIYFDENNPSRIPTSDALRTVLFGERAASSSRHFDVGYHFLPSNEAKTQRLVEEVRRILGYLNTTTTGARSVINPPRGTEDSPIGNATMIPVLELLDLQKVSHPVKTYIGYDRTNIGFQLIQEAYRRGEWSNFPRFKKGFSTRLFEYWEGLWHWKWRQ